MEHLFSRGERTGPVVSADDGIAYGYMGEERTRNSKRVQLADTILVGDGGDEGGESETVYI